MQFENWQSSLNLIEMNKNNTDFYHCVSIEKWVDGCVSASEEPPLEK